MGNIASALRTLISLWRTVALVLATNFIAAAVVGALLRRGDVLWAIAVLTVVVGATMFGFGAVFAWREFSKQLDMYIEQEEGNERS